MIPYALGFAIGCFALGLALNLWQVTRAREVPDRVLALDTMVINVI
ncbi:MAG: K+/H+ antiporter subunit F, partial [Alphaproteobacteria bacterium]|nr:K+/H+ antiporter subunit F [Alphaproteobacteria bacterium]